MSRPSALVTGGAGFIGRHMCAELERRGWDVISVDLEATEVVWFPQDGARTSRLHVISDVHEFFHNLGSTQRNVIGGWSTGDDPRYDLVVHCAYHVGGRAGIDGRNNNFTRNVRLDSTVFEWAVRTHQPRVLYWSSSAVYPATYQNEAALKNMSMLALPLTEDLQAPGDDRAPECESLYGWAKYVGELLAESARANGVRVTVVRPFSGYGTDQSLDYPFPTFISHAQARRDPFPVWGSATQLRDWIHVTDVINGALALVDAEVDGPVNICTGRATAMGDLIRLITDAVGYSPELDVITDAPTGVGYRVGNPTMFFDHYHPAVSLEEGVDRALRGVL
jgi:nucleoside-diphosphate-sugar epimerase